MQGIIGGATSYEEQSLKDILNDIDGWYTYTDHIKKYIIEQRQTMIESGFWDKVDFDFKLTIETSITYFDTIIHDLSIIRASIDKGCVTQKEVKLLRNIGVKAHEYNAEYPKTFKQSYGWRDYGNPDFEPAENSYAKGRDFFVTLQDAANAASRLEDYMENGNIINNNMNINGNISDSQVQVGNINSSQNINITTNFDYEKVLDVLKEIKEYIEMPKFKETFKDETDNVISLINSSIKAVENKENPSLIKKSLNIIKDLAIGATGSLIASGILSLLQTIQL